MIDDDRSVHAGEETPVGDELTEAASPAVAGRRPGKWLWIVLSFVLVALVALWFLGLPVWPWRSVQTADPGGEIASLTARLDAVERKMQHWDDQWQASPVSGDRADGTISRRLAEAEVEFLLTLAMHRLSLERELDAALAALTEVERRLEDLPVEGAGDVLGHVQTIREELSLRVQERGQARARLDELSDVLNALPWQAAETGKAGAPVDAGGAPEENGGWLDMKKWITIRRQDDPPVVASISGEDARGLSQNHVLAMDLAWARGDTVDFRKKAERLQRLLRERFPVDATTAPVFDLLSELAVAEVFTAVDDSALYSALESWRALGAARSAEWRMTEEDGKEPSGTTNEEELAQ